MLSRQLCIVSMICPRNQSSSETRPPSGGFDQFSVSPSPFVLGNQTFFVSSSGSYAKRGWKGVRLNANVGQRGIGPSKKWIGKLLVIPPSGNQQRDSRGSPRSPPVPLAAQLKSKPQRGRALIRIGKLRLIRTATTTGR